MDGWMDGMLGKCCLFGVSDLFLTCFWPFPGPSSTSKKSARAVKLGTILVIVKVISLLVPQILVLVLLVVVVVGGGGGVVEVVVVIVIVEVAMIRAEVDGWMDGWMLGKCCLFGVSDLFWPVSDLFSLELAWMSFWPENICADSARAESARADSARQLLAWFWSRK